MSVDAILEAVWSLSAEERADFDARLRVGPDPDADEMPPELKAELRRRVENAKANPGVGYTWEEVVAHVKRKK